jgi:ABC-type nitrate/sulfonate/bicarbonate transport system permease component
MYAWTVVLALVGLGMALGFNALERRLIFWSSRR